MHSNGWNSAWGGGGGGGVGWGGVGCGCGCEGLREGRRQP